MGNRFNFNPDIFSEIDKLGFDQYIQTLSGMIKDKDFKTPFCIGVYGKWGSGKTSFMRLLSQHITAAGGKPYVIPVWFNPWRYEKEKHLIIPFLKTIEQEIKTYQKKKENIPDKPKEKLGKIVRRIGLVARAFAYSTTINAGVIEIDASKAVDREKELEEDAMTLGEHLSSVYYDIVNQLQEFTDEKTFRIAVFIDDLDRCLPEKAIELLEAIKLFLDLKGYLFVLGVDKEVVEKGIAYHYRHLDYNDNAKEKENSTKSKAEDYLDKMIQFPLELPPVEASYKSEYIKSLLGENEAYKNLAGLIEKGVGDNPRSLKRFVNFLAFMSWHADTVKDKILKDKEESAEHKKIIEENFVPVLYVKWSLIVLKFPTEYKAIKGKRHLLIEMQEAIKEGDVQMPSQLKEILQAEQLFLDNDYLLKTLVHLVQATKVAVTPTVETEVKYAKEPQYKPGDMVLINKGSFLYGEDKRELNIDYDYYMDVFPVTNQQYQEFINDKKDYPVPYREEGWAKSYNWDKEKRIYPQGKGNHPVVLVSYNDAVAFCQWRSKKDGQEYRLPFEEEWEKAARGNDGRIYPWGNEFDQRKCNSSESGIGGTTEVTKYPQGTSPYGCYDMAGNIWEWTDSWYDSEKKSKVLRGGSWDNDVTYSRGADRGGGDPGYGANTFGFRCARTKK